MKEYRVALMHPLNGHFDVLAGSALEALDIVARETCRRVKLMSVTQYNGKLQEPVVLHRDYYEPVTLKEGLRLGCALSNSQIKPGDEGGES